MRRDDGSKQQLALSTLPSTVPQLLTNIQKDMLARATKVRDDHLKHVKEWKDFVPALNAKNLVLIPWCEQTKCEDDIKDRSARYVLSIFFSYESQYWQLIIGRAPSRSRTSARRQWAPSRCASRSSSRNWTRAASASTAASRRNAGRCLAVAIRWIDSKLRVELNPTNKK